MRPAEPVASANFASACLHRCIIVNVARCPPRPAERAASVVRLQAAELVKWRFRHGQVLAPQAKGKAMRRTRSESWSQQTGWAGSWLVEGLGWAGWDELGWVGGKSQTLGKLRHVWAQRVAGWAGL